MVVYVEQVCGGGDVVVGFVYGLLDVFLLQVIDWGYCIWWFKIVVVGWVVVFFVQCMQNYWYCGWFGQVVVGVQFDCFYGGGDVGVIGDQQNVYVFV